MMQKVVMSFSFHQTATFLECGSQRYVWPPKFTCTVENPDPPPIKTLILHGLHSLNRAIILNFDTYFLKIIYLIFL